LKDPDHRVKVSIDDLQAVVASTRDADEISHIVENILDSIIEMGKFSVKNVMRKIEVSNHAHSGVVKNVLQSYWHSQNGRTT
jgi:predicted DNA-binding ArsR family transcriptional regulator